MKKKNKIIPLLIILIILLIIIVILLVSINNKGQFKKIAFDNNASENIPENINYENSIITIANGYSLYINPQPKVINKNNLKIDFISLDTNTIWIKVRILDENNKVIAETGLIKPGEYLETVNLNNKIAVDEMITYKIMGYEMDTYYSAGSFNLKTKVGI